eukprot:2556700-Prorocentrum_lima.AAC.1
MGCFSQTEVRCSQGNPQGHRHASNIGSTERDVHMSQIPPYQPQSNGLIKRMVGTIKEHMRKALH